MTLPFRLLRRSICTQRPIRLGIARWYTTESPPKIELRDYQQAAITSVLEHLKRGERRLGISLATGSGKTVVFSHLIEQVPSPTPQATQTLVLAHRRELVEQAAKHCQNVYPHKKVEIEMGDLRASGTADITVASVATIRRRLDKYNPASFKLLIVDEAHHITAPSYTDITSWFGTQDKDSQVALVGVSATFSRSDGISLGSAFDRITYHKDYLEMIDEDYLSSLMITTVQTGVDLTKVKLQRGDFSIPALSTAVNTPSTNKLTVRSWLAKAQGRHSTLVFCVDIQHVKSLTAEFRNQGIDARSILGSTVTSDRADTLRAFRQQEFPVLVNCGIFTEGTDIPNIDCVLLARPTRSRNLLIQMVGRGLRKHQSKQNCHVIDMVGSLRQGIVTAPTLYGLDPQEVLDEADAQRIQVVKEERARQSETDTRHDSVAFTDYDDVHDYIADTAGEQRLRALSRYSWIEIDSAHFILTNNTGDYLKIQPDRRDASTFEVVVLRRLLGSKSPFMRPRLIAESLAREAAIAAADTFASNNFTHTYLLRWSPWRRAPATEGQLKFLNKFRDSSEKLEPDTVTKGQASDWITKLKHGAKARFARGTKEIQKIADLESKEAAKARLGMQGPIL